MPPSEQSRASIRRYLLVDQGIAALGINIAINAAIGWLICGKLAVVPLTGDPSLTRDVHGTCIVLSLIANLIVTRITRSRVRLGQLPAIRPPQGPWLIHQLVVRGLLLAIASDLLVGWPTVWLLQLLAPEGMSLTSFLVFKSLLAGGLGLIICPLSGWLALGDEVEDSGLPV